MARKPYSPRRGRPEAAPACEASPALARILDDMQSPDAATRAGAVRELCPCPECRRARGEPG